MFKNLYQNLVMAVSIVAIVLVGGAILAMPGIYLLSPASPARADDGSIITLMPPPQEDLYPRTIAVNGTGTARTPADIATVSFSVEFNGASLDESSAEAIEVFDALRELGIADSDFQTTYYNVYRDTSYDYDLDEAALVFYTSNSFDVVVRDLSMLETVIETAFEAGADRVDNILFNVSDPLALQAEARLIAVDEGRLEAEELAALYNADIGEVVSITEGYTGDPFAGWGGSTTESFDGFIAPPEVEVTVEINVTYELVN